MLYHLSRAQLLYQQSRFTDAEKEVRQVLLEEPHDAAAHALLGLCLMRQDKLPEAQEETEQAIVLAPDNPFSHYTHSIVLGHRKRYQESEASAREALRLDPSDPDYYGQVAAALLQQKKWQPALEACREGLQYDAEHAACNHWQTMALTKLGRQDESLATVDEALSRDPDDEMAHANKGWALLHQGKPKPALEHFREALRLDPNFEYAQAGIVESLKARNPIYRWMLAYFLWMARLNDRVKWGIIIGAWLGYRFLAGLQERNPALTPWVAPVMIAYLIFVLLTWFSYPLFNLLLRLNKFGRHALSKDQRIASNWFGACLLVFAVGAMTLAIGPSPVIENLAICSMIYAAGMALPLVTLFQCDVGWPRRAMTYFAIAMALVGGIGFASDFLSPGTTITRPLLLLFFFGFIATPWVANYLASATARR